MSTHKDWIENTGPCLTCRGELRPQMGSLEYRVDDIAVTVESVPMSVCMECGKRIIPGVVAMAIDDLVQEIIAAERAASVADRVTIHYREREHTAQYAYAD